MIKKLPEYVNMFKEDDRPLLITMQIKEHFVRLDSDQQGYGVLLDSLRNIPFELLRYGADDDTINLGLKSWED